MRDCPPHVFLRLYHVDFGPTAEQYEVLFQLGVIGAGKLGAVGHHVGTNTLTLKDSEWAPNSKPLVSGSLPRLTRPAIKSSLTLSASSVFHLGTPYSTPLPHGCLGLLAGAGTGDG